MNFCCRFGDVTHTAQKKAMYLEAPFVLDGSQSPDHSSRGQRRQIEDVGGTDPSMAETALQRGPGGPRQLRRTQSQPGGNLVVRIDADGSHIGAQNSILMAADLEEQGRYEEATEIYKAALGLQPLAQKVRQAVGVCMLHRHRCASISTRHCHDSRVLCIHPSLLPASPDNGETVDAAVQSFEQVWRNSACAEGGEAVFEAESAKHEGVLPARTAAPASGRVRRSPSKFRQNECGAAARQ